MMLLSPAVRPRNPSTGDKEIVDDESFVFEVIWESCVVSARGGGATLE